MTAAQILDKLLDDLGDLECPRGHVGYRDHARYHRGCSACRVLDRVVDIIIEAENERDRARLIFGEAA